MDSIEDSQTGKRNGITIEKQVVISGYYGFGNAGDEAVLAGIARSFADVCPDIRLLVQSIAPEATKSLQGLDAVHRYKLIDVIDSIRKSDLFISGGGSLLQDVTSGRSVLYYLAVIALAKILRKKVMIYAQGIGPLNSKFVRRFSRSVLNRTDLITVRDEQSVQTLRDLGIRRPPIQVTADPSFAVEAAGEEEVRSILAKAGAAPDAKMLGVALRPWENQQKWLPEITEALKKAAADLELTPVFLPMQKSMDLSMTLSAADTAASSPVVIADQLTPAQAKGVAASMHVFVSMRLHALIFAASAGVPFVAISYDPKVTEFARIAGQPVIDVQSVTSASLYEAVREAHERHDELSNEIRERIEPITRLAVQNAELACGLLEGS